MNTHALATRIRGLYAITPTDLHSPDMLARAYAALQGGAQVLQYRDKSHEPARRRREAETLRRWCTEVGAVFIVNDDVTLARAVQADAVHLGRDDGVWPSDIPTGISCYNDMACARQAATAGALYVAFGAVFPSSTKPHAVSASLDLFSATRPLGVPRVAIGGITLENAARVFSAGASAVAVIADLFQANDIAEQAHRYHQLFLRLSHESERHSV